ncbi:transglutaminase domain-containing protein [Phnomibacter sp. MR]|uniref:transglutaminase domain-containing protein n=1 Tax=Phnomibacter sp. MR TaxID=3042318 RepID=UPI003A7FD67E
MKKILVIFFLLGFHFCNSGYGQTPIDSENDEIRQIVSSVIPTNKQIGDSVKAALLFKWVAENIKYDYELASTSKLVSFNNEWNFETRNLETILKGKKAVCNGVSLLYFELCKAAGLKVKEIDGEVKGYRNGTEFVFYMTNPHTWNLVFWNGQWHPIDCTWALTDGINSSLDWFWFNTNSDYFFLTHYADSARYNLGYEDVSTVQFKMLPYFKQDFFDKFRINRSIIRDFLAGKTSVLSFFKYPKVGVTTFITKMNDCSAAKVNTANKKLLNVELKKIVANDKAGCYSITTVLKENKSEEGLEIKVIKTTDDVARFNFKKSKL